MSGQGEGGMPHPRTAWVLWILSGCAGPVLEQELPLGPVRTGKTVSIERLRYSAALFGLPVGTATWETTEGQEGRKITFRGRSNSAVDSIHPVRGHARALQDVHGAPRHFVVRWTQEGFTRERTLEFGEALCLSWREGERRSAAPAVIPSNHPLDLLSFLERLRRLDPGSRARDFEVALGPHLDYYRVSFLRREDVELAAGFYPASLTYQVAVHPRHFLGEDAIVGPERARYELTLTADSPARLLRVRRELAWGCFSLELAEVLTSGSEPEEIGETLAVDDHDQPLEARLQ